VTIQLATGKVVSGIFATISTLSIDTNYFNNGAESGLDGIALSDLTVASASLTSAGSVSIDDLRASGKVQFAAESKKGDIAINSRSASLFQSAYFGINAKLAELSVESCSLDTKQAASGKYAATCPGNAANPASLNHQFSLKAAGSVVLSAETAATACGVSATSDPIVTSPAISSPNQFPAVSSNAQFCPATDWVCTGCTLTSAGCSELVVVRNGWTNTATLFPKMAGPNGLAANRDIRVRVKVRLQRTEGIPDNFLDNTEAQATVQVLLGDFKHWWQETWEMNQFPSSIIAQSTPVTGYFDESYREVDVTVRTTKLVAAPVVGIRLDKLQGEGYSPTYYVKDLVVEQLAMTITQKPAAGIHPSRVANIPVQASTTDPNPRTGCPHLQSNLKPWGDEQTWASVGGKPLPGAANVTLPANTKVIIRSCELSTAAYGEINVPASSELIFDDANIHLRVNTLRVQGALRIGSPTCRMFSNIKITFS
jgi:hypothetical protein